MGVSIIGAGYVGLITAVGLANAGHRVILVERRADVVEKIRKGESHIYEIGLEPLLKEVLGKGLLEVTSSIAEAISGSEITMVCVATPSDKEGNIDLADIRTVGEQVGIALKGKAEFHTFIVKSTVIPGTTEYFGGVVAKASGKELYREFGIGMNPEFLREGNAIEDFVNVDRVIIGTNDPQSKKEINRLYAFVKAPIINVNVRTAEMIKYANNSFFALCISFSNEIAQICGLVDDVNPYEVMSGVVHDKRLSLQEGEAMRFAGVAGYLVPGCGFGGSCFPKDVKALRQFSYSKGYTPRLVEGIINVNESQIREAVRKLNRSLVSLDGKEIAIMGVAFKPDTDDIRESPSIKIIDAILEEGGHVRAYDPKALDKAKRVYGDRITYCKTHEELLKGADAAVLVTKWSEFGKISPEEFKRLLKNPLLLDCRGFYPAEKYSKQLDYQILGMRGSGRKS